MKTTIHKILFRAVAASASLVVAMTTMLMTVSAANMDTAIEGKLYNFEENSKYEISSAESYVSTSSADTYGDFYINGDLRSAATKDGVSAFEVKDGGLSLSYKYNDTLLNADLDSWHLVEDKVNQIDGHNLGSDVLKGAIWLQTSIDHINWSDAVCLTDAFNTTPISSDVFYTAKDVELINGCYYKVIVAYKTSIRTEQSNILFVNTDKYDFNKCAEVYEFYAFTDGGEKDDIDYSQTYNMGSKVRVENFDGYYGQTDISKDDIHYGWDIGNFFVSGYTDKIPNDDGSVVFLKNVGDKVTLWFDLQQNIDAIKDNTALSVTADSEGYDQYFETPRTDFGRGTLIVRYTDHNNNKSAPQIYTNYLQANTSFGAETKVQLFEEGDYEVALDYEITNDGFIDTVGHYRIFFEFSVRNGNCMVYPFDVATGRELTNSSMTENGFRLDLARSRYLKINIKREVLKDSADGLVEDTRFNGPAKDGAVYTDEGIYTITVNNEYTGQTTEKKIYVGTNSILRAHMATGKPISEINQLVADGATILEDGTIKLAAIVEPEIPNETSQPTQVITPSTQVTTETVAGTTADDADTDEPTSPVTAIIVVVILTVGAGAVIVFVVLKKKRTENNEGGDN